MSTRLAIRGLIISVLALAIGCNEFALDTAWRSEDYRLVWVDAPAEMSLYCKAGDGRSLLLVDATIFAVGENKTHIVVAQHPKVGFGFDRSVTRYFIIERVPRSGYPDREKGVRGPLSKEEFDRLSASLSLPKFTKTFDDLK